MTHGKSHFSERLLSLRPTTACKSQCSLHERYTTFKTNTLCSCYLVLARDGSKQPYQNDRLSSKRDRTKPNTVKKTNNSASSYGSHDTLTLVVRQHMHTAEYGRKYLTSVPKVQSASDFKIKGKGKRCSKTVDQFTSAAMIAVVYTRYENSFRNKGSNKVKETYVYY